MSDCKKYERSSSIIEYEVGDIIGNELKRKYGDSGKKFYPYLHCWLICIYTQTFFPLHSNGLLKGGVKEGE